MPVRTSDSIEIAVMRVLCKRFKTDIAKQLLANHTAENYMAVDLNPAAYKDPALFSKDYLLTSFLRKWKGWKMDVSPKEVAIRGWTAAEGLNKQSNLRLSDSNLPFGVLAFITSVQQKIESVIGTEPDFAVLDPLCKWGPGATFDIRKGDGTDPAIKMSRCITVTKRALPHLMRVVDEHWANAATDFGLTQLFQIVQGNRCVTVPKNAKTDRMIAAEPTGNSFLQQSVGQFFRRRLLAFGVNLSDQSVNQELAFRALVDELSTLDLSMASDTLCLILVSLFLPAAWFDYLCDIRSPYSRLGGKWYFLEKFASMGNAFTFELESLIFWAISSVVVEKRGPVSVYGDDIIVPRACYDDVAAALKFCGFTPNAEKSYRDGPFFESCGKQYHSLEDVTPAYQKEVVGNNLGELVRLHNRISRWGLRNGLHLVKDALVLITTRAHEMHPRLKKLPRIPLSEGDAGFITALPHKDIKEDRNGDFRCYVLAEQPLLIHGISRREVFASYAYKLRRPIEENGLPDGQFAVLVGQRTRLQNRVVWRSSCKSS